MAWSYLIIAGLFEVACTTVFRYTGGLTRLGPTAAFFVLGLLSLYCLNKSLSGVPLGTAYAIWTGIGAAGTAIIGIAAFGEASTLPRILLLTLLIGSIAGLKLVTDH